MIIKENMTQGTHEWLAYRATARNASEAAAVLNQDKYITRQELLRNKATGLIREIDPATQRLFDEGHKSEELARPTVSETIGEEVYPITATSDDNYLSASFDGVTMDESTIWENKLFNQGLCDYVSSNNDLPDTHWPQVEQQIMVSKASRCLFTLCSKNGIVLVNHWYTSRPERQAKILAAWQQFDIDLANYQHVEVKAEATGKAPDALPALRIEVTGMVTASNLAEFKAHALAVFAGINTDLQTDEDFANAEKTVKWCKDVESRLDAAKEHALSQTQSIDELFKALDAIKAESSRVRLDLNKQGQTQKENRRADIIKRGREALANHITTINTMLGKPYMPVIVSDFPGAIKGKSKISAMEDAANAELARCKIIADATGKNIQINLNTLRDMASDYKTLFTDTATIVLKNNDDLVALIKMRISDHEKEVADKKARELAALQAKEDRERVEAEAQAVVVPVVQPASAQTAQVMTQGVQTKQSGIMSGRPATIDPAMTAFLEEWDSTDPRYRHDIMKDALMKWFVNGYNLGKRHGQDAK